MKKVTWILFLCCSTALFAQKTNQVDGYFTKVSGEVLKYFSPLHEFADSSLLTRCNGNSMITMRAEIPQNEEAFTQFRFLIGHSSGTSSADRHFQISLNGKELFVLETKAKRSGLFLEDSRPDSNLPHHESHLSKTPRRQSKR